MHLKHIIIAAADLVPMRINLDLQPGEWGIQSVVVCDPTLEGVTTSETITLYSKNGSNTNLDPGSEINGTLDYFMTTRRGITQHKWITTNGNLMCREIISRFYNNVSLGLSGIGVRVIIRKGTFSFQRNFNVTFLVTGIASGSGDGSGSGGSGYEPDHDNASENGMVMITTESEKPQPGVIAESTAIGVTVPMAVVIVAAICVVVVLAFLLLNRQKPCGTPVHPELGLNKHRGDEGNKENNEERQGNSTRTKR